jgi:carbon-nitrogen hydrolase
MRSIMRGLMLECAAYCSRPQSNDVAAAVQRSPAFLDREATIDRACESIAEAAARGAKLVVFPEAFVPGFPVWVWWVAAGQTHELRALYAELLDQSVVESSATGKQLGVRRDSQFFEGLCYVVK